MTPSPLEMLHQSSPLSLYIHIPFCRRKCRYCDFFSVPFTNDLANAYIDALIKEYHLLDKKYALSGRNIHSIYFGGGTPGILPVELWKRLIDNVCNTLHFTPTYEWSVEFNPESFTETLAEVLLDGGCNRLTFGVQSLNDRELTLCGRVHSASTALAVLKQSTLSGFKSIGADIIYGLPGQTVQSLQDTLDKILDTQIKHLSAYELTISSDTPFGRHTAILPRPDEDCLAQMSACITETCKHHGLSRYEVSNYAQRGFESLHNIAYWNHKPYIGLGCSAHSYYHPYRWSNISDTTQYIDSLKKDKLPIDFKETVNHKMLKEELIFLGLRTTAGINETLFFNYTGEHFHAGDRRSHLDEFLRNGFIVYQAPRWFCSEKGIEYADAIARTLI